MKQRPLKTPRDLTVTWHALKAFFILALVAFHAHATPLPDGMRKIASVEGITEFRLHNGLRVLVAPNASTPTTLVNMTYLVGSRHESYGQTGTAHLLEHLLFKGTPTTPDALAEFARRGFSDYNASTSADYTNYYAHFNTQPDKLRWYLGWLADTMVNVSLTRKALDGEMTVVRNEMEKEENHAGAILRQKMQAAAFQWHNYGKATIGARSDLENVDLAALRAFYHQYYRPDNAVLILTGQFDLNTSLQAINQTLGQLPRPTRPLPTEHTLEPVQDGERQVTLRRAGGTPIVAAMYHTPAGNNATSLPLRFAISMLVDPPSGRLYRQLVSRHLAAGVGGGLLDYRDASLAIFSAALDPGMDPHAANQALLTTLESLSQHPFTEEELTRTKRKWLNDWQRVRDLPSTLSAQLSQASAQGDWRLFFLQRDWARHTTLADVQRVATTYLITSNRTSGQYIPTPTPVRAPPIHPEDLTAALKNYQGDPTHETPVATFELTPKNIEAHTQQRTLALPNGQITLALLPKPNESHRVQANLLIQLGDVSSLVGQQNVARAVISLLNRGVATSTLSRQAVQDKFDALQTEFSFEENGTGGVLVSLSSTREHLPAALETLLDMIRHPIFAADQVEEYKAAALTIIQNARTTPSALASYTLARQDNPWSPDDIRYLPSFEEWLARIRTLAPDALTQFHAKFYGAGTLAFSAVGDFDVNQVQQALQTGLASWPHGMPYTRVPYPFHAIAPHRFEISTPDKANAVYRAELPLNLQDTSADYPALVLANYLLGGSPDSRLWQRIRQREGLSYGVYSAISLSSFEPTGTWALEASYAPANRQRLEQAMQEELTRVSKEGFTPAEVKQGITSLLQLRQSYRTEDARLAQMWIHFLDTKRPFSREAYIDHQLRVLTADKVNAALRQYLSPQAFSTVVAGDFKDSHQ